MQRKQTLIMFSVVILLLAFSLTACETLDNMMKNDKEPETPNNTEKPNTSGNQNNSDTNSSNNQDQRMEPNQQQR